MDELAVICEEIEKKGGAKAVYRQFSSDDKKKFDLPETRESWTEFLTRHFIFVTFVCGILLVFFYAALHS
jgi:hypothetical protein